MCRGELLKVYDGKIIYKCKIKVDFQLPELYNMIRRNTAAVHFGSIENRYNYGRENEET